MAFLFSWLAVTPLIMDPTLAVEPFQIVGALAGPTLAAVIVTAVTGGRPALAEFFRAYGRWRVGLGWWLLAVFGALLALTLVAGLIVGGAVISTFFLGLGLILPAYLVTLLLGIILGPLWEEPGWRGFALPRLQAQFGPLAGTLLLGVLWALWHLPGYLGGWMTAGPAALLVSSVGFSVLMTWIYNNTRGSVLLMILLHSSSNAALSIGGRVLPENLPLDLAGLVYGGWIPAITYGVLALVVLAATRGSLSYAQPSAPPAGAALQPAP
jgi:membrane protease YdiL (CAAX protease family)